MTAKTFKRNESDFGSKFSNHMKKIVANITKDDGNTVIVSIPPFFKCGILELVKMSILKEYEAGDECMLEYAANVIPMVRDAVENLVKDDELGLKLKETQSCPKKRAEANKSYLTGLVEGELRNSYSKYMNTLQQIHGALMVHKIVEQYCSLSRCSRDDYKLFMQNVGALGVMSRYLNTLEGLRDDLSVKKENNPSYIMTDGKWRTLSIGGGKSFCAAREKGCSCDNVCGVADRLIKFCELTPGLNDMLEKVRKSEVSDKKVIQGLSLALEELIERDKKILDKGIREKIMPQ